VIHEIDDPGGDCKSEALAATALGKNEGVEADDRSVHVDERAAAVAGVNGRIGLNVSERLFRIGLAGDGANHSHGDGIL
jgi:hypothetical protein